MRRKEQPDYRCLLQHLDHVHVLPLCGRLLLAEGHGIRVHLLQFQERTAQQLLHLLQHILINFKSGNN